MNWLGIQSIAHVAVERVLNSLPEGLLVAFFAWLLLRLIGRQNSGTRFAVWFMALIAVIGLSFAGGFQLNEARTLLPASHLTSQIVVPSFWAVILLAVWSLVSLVTLARLFTGLWQVWTIRRSCKEVDLVRLDPLIQQTFLQYEAGRPIRLVISERAKVPAAIGFWKPVIMLPTWTLQELTPSELQPILIHELTHLKRRDDWTNLLQKVVRAVFFFHPAVWWIDARLSLEREMACDDAVLANTGNPHAYASCLVELLEKSCARRKWTMVQAAVHHARELSLRITRILDAKRPANTQVWKPALALTSLFSLACFALSYCTPRLVAFAPTTNTSDSAAHIAKVHEALHTDDVALASMHAAVIPASYHIPASPTLEKRTAGNRKKTAKQHIPTKPAVSRLTAEYQQPQVAPRVVMAKAVNASPRKDTAPMVQLVVYIETTDARYDPADYNENLPTNAATWKTQIWQIVLIAPAQNAAQAEVLASQI